MKLKVFRQGLNAGLIIKDVAIDQEDFILEEAGDENIKRP